MILTKLLNINDEFEYLNMEQLASITQLTASGVSYYEVIFSGGVTTHISLSETKLETLITNAV